MPSRRLLLIACLAHSACIRHFESLTPPDATVPIPLSITPAFATVAPGESLALSAAGGAGDYHFAFDTAPLSGASVELDAMGRYRAGLNGSATDVVAVTDAAGNRAIARISVGAPLTVTPAQSLLAPGGSVQLSASGGKPPYTWSLEDLDGEASIDNGIYAAGALGSRRDVIVVSDATGVASARASVDIGAPLTLFTATDAQVAPLGTASLIATGGQPPYVFDLMEDLSGGSVDPLGGFYQAGETGGVTDLVRVTDANAQARILPITVTSRLSLTLSDDDPRPGRHYALLPSGGKPPYQFGFKRRGNHSAGSIGVFSGDYVPGYNVGVTDTLEVTDSNGATAECSAKIGYLLIEAAGANRCLRGDFDNDGHDELLLAHIEASPVGLARAQLVEFVQSSGRVKSIRDLSLPTSTTNPVSEIVVADVNGDAFADIVTLRLRKLEAWLTDLQGSPSAPLTLFEPDSPSPATSLFHMAVGQDVSTRILAFAYRRNSGAVDEPPCSTNDAGIAAITWNIAAGTMQPPVCLVDMALPAIPNIRLALAGIDSVPGPDVLWSMSGSISAYRRPSGNLPTPLALPAGFSLDSVDHYLLNGSPLVSSGASEIVLRLKENATGVHHLAALGCDSAVSCAAVVSSPPAPAFPGGDAIARALTFHRAFASLTHFFVVNETTGALRGFSVSGSSVSASTAPFPSATFIPSCAVDIDTDGDLVRDVVLSSPADFAEVLPGEASGLIATRPFFRDIGDAVTAIDIDADGADDVLSVDRYSASLYVQQQAELALTARVGFSEQLTGAVFARAAAPAAGGVLFVSDARKRVFSILIDEAGGAGIPEAAEFADEEPISLETNRSGAGRFLAGKAELAYGTEITPEGHVAFILDPNGGSLNVRRMPAIPADSCIAGAADLDQNERDELVMLCLESGQHCFRVSDVGQSGGIATGAWPAAACIAGAEVPLQVNRARGAVVAGVSTGLTSILHFNGAQIVRTMSAEGVLSQLRIGRIDGDNIEDVLIVHETGIKAYFGVSGGSFTPGVAVTYATPGALLLSPAAGAAADMWKLDRGKRLGRYVHVGSGEFE